MFILKTGHQPGVYVPLRALFLVENIMNRFQFIVQTRNSVTKFQGKLLKQCKCKSYGSCTLHIVVFVKSYMKIA